MTAVSEWSFHRALFSGDLNHLDFPAYAADIGFDTLEYSNHFFRRTDWLYVQELKKRVEDAGVTSRLLMVDGCGFLGGKADIATHQRFTRWMWVAKELGCSAMRVMVRHPDGESLEAAADEMTNLVLNAKEFRLQVVVENHGGKSSDPIWLQSLFARVPGLKLFSDFGNWGDRDPYAATKMLLPDTWGFSGKVDDNLVNFLTMRKLGAQKPSAEWEGSSMSEEEGALYALTLIEGVWPTASSPSPPQSLFATEGSS